MSTKSTPDKAGEKSMSDKENKEVSNYSTSGHYIHGILLAKIEFWTKRYEFSFQFWGTDNNNVYINRGTVEIASFGGEGTIKEILEMTLDWCEKSSPSMKYPASLIITNHQP